MTAPRKDRYAEYRGKWDKSGAWWCDCPAKRPDTQYRCARCCIRRPLKAAQVYELRDVNQSGGFMHTPSLVPVKRGGAA